MSRGKIHIGRRKTLKALCGKSVARRWWVEAEHEEFGRLATLRVYRVVKPESATCPACIRRAAK